MKPKIFNSETDLCGCFRDFIVRQGDWEIHVETEDHWDLLLVRELEFGEIEQWGVHGKLLANIDVVYQACQGMRRPQGPNAAVVLVPKAGDKFRWLCGELGLFLAVPNLRASDLANGEVEFTVVEPHPFNKHPPAPERCKVPKYQNSTKPGSRSPSVVSGWKEMELMLEVFLEDRGYLRRTDFRKVGWPIDSVKAPNWLYKLKGRDRYEVTMTATMPSSLQPKSFADIKAEMTSRGLANA